MLYNNNKHNYNEIYIMRFVNTGDILCYWLGCGEHRAGCRRRSVRLCALDDPLVSSHNTSPPEALTSRLQATSTRDSLVGRNKNIILLICFKMEIKVFKFFSACDFLSRSAVFYNFISDS